MTDSTSPQRPLTFSLARWSALVRPMFKMAIGNFLSLAAIKNLYPEYTCGLRKKGHNELQTSIKMCCELLFLLKKNFFLKPTCNEDPTTSTASDSASLSCTNWTVALFTVSPKNVTSGFSIPPQFSQEGTLKLRTCSLSKKTSPSGATAPA